MCATMIMQNRRPIGEDNDPSFRYVRKEGVRSQHDDYQIDKIGRCTACVTSRRPAACYARSKKVEAAQRQYDLRDTRITCHMHHRPCVAQVSGHRPAIAGCPLSRLVSTIYGTGAKGQAVEKREQKENREDKPWLWFRSSQCRCRLLPDREDHVAER